MARRVLVFDGDDTLWWTEQLYDEARARAAAVVAAQGLDAAAWDGIEREIDVENVARFGLARERFPTSCVEAYERIARISHVPVVRKVRDAVWKAADSVFTSTAPVVDGARDVLEEVASFGHLAVLTKGDDAVQRLRLEASGLRSFFEHVAIVPSKSSEDFERVLQTFGAHPRESWSIGNSWRSDIEPASILGMPSIWIDAHVWEFERHDAATHEHEAVHVARTLRDVPGILRSSLSRNGVR